MNTDRNPESNPTMDFDLIFDMYHMHIYRYCFHMIRNSEDAEDVVQEVFLNTYRQMQSKKKIYAITPWLYKSAYNASLNIIKRRKLISFINLDPFNASLQRYAEDTAGINEFSDEVSYALLSLTTLERSVLLLRILEEMDYKEISIIMGKKQEALRKLYERSKKKVTKYITNAGRGNTSEKATII